VIGSVVLGAQLPVDPTVSVSSIDEGHIVRRRLFTEDSPSKLDRTPGTGGETATKTRSLRGINWISFYMLYFHLTGDRICNPPLLTNSQILPSS
jgi:hypothetical protein